MNTHDWFMVTVCGVCGVILLVLVVLSPGIG